MEASKVMVWPIVTEVIRPKVIIEHDPFIDDLKPLVAEHLAEILDLSANVIYLADYKENAA